jgi:hypothetical protein
MSPTKLQERAHDLLAAHAAFSATPETPILLESRGDLAFELERRLNTLKSVLCVISSASASADSPADGYAEVVEALNIMLIELPITNKSGKTLDAMSAAVRAALDGAAVNPGGGKNDARIRHKGREDGEEGGARTRTVRFEAVIGLSDYYNSN